MTVTYDDVIIELQPELLSRARQLTKDPDDAWDLVQETFLKAFRAWDRFDGTFPRAWLYRILLNTYINGYRTTARRPKQESKEEWEIYQRTRGNFSSPASDEFVEREFSPALVDALAALPEVFRDAVLLYDVEGYSYLEIAEALEIPLGTVTSRLHRGRTQLRKNLTELGMNSTTPSLRSSDNEAPAQAGG